MADELIAGLREALGPFLSVSSLTDLYHAYKSIPTIYALIGHCLFCATLAPEFKHRFLLHFWMTYLAGFGGGIISSLLIMDPVKAPINILSNNTIGLTWLICWWVMTYFPFNLPAKLHSLLPVRMLTKACVSFMRANLIIQRVDLAVSLYPGVVAAPLILGTLAGSGGKMITDGIRGGWGALPGTAEVSVPGFVWRSAALAAAGYWGASKATGLLTSQEAAALVITVLVAHSILSDLLGAELSDFTVPVARVAHTVSLVPMPSAAGTAANPSGKVSKAVAKQQQQQAAAAKAQPAAVQPAAPNGAASQAKQTASGKNNAAGGASVKADSTTGGGRADATAGGKKESKKKR